MWDPYIYISIYYLIKEKYLEKPKMPLYKAVTHGTFVGFLVISASHFHLCWLLHVPSFSTFTLHPSCPHQLLLPLFAWSPHQLQYASFVFFLSSSSFISSFCFYFLLSFPLAEVFHFLFATRGFLRAFFLLHFCGPSLPVLLWFSIEFLLLCMFSS